MTGDLVFRGLVTRAGDRSEEIAHAVGDLGQVRGIGASRLGKFFSILRHIEIESVAMQDVGVLAELRRLLSNGGDGGLKPVIELWFVH